MITNTSTLSLAPGTKINELDMSKYGLAQEMPSPICLMFGFSPMGAVLEPRYMTTIGDVEFEYGRPETSLEKYFYNAAIRVIKGGGTALMTRLPYDNAQANKVKYVRYEIEKPIHRQYVYANENSEYKYRQYDSDGIDVLNRMHELDSQFNGYSRIKLASTTIEEMEIDRFDEVMLDATDLENDSIYIFDIKKQQLGTNDLLTDPDFQYLGIVPVLVTTSTALYIQEKIANNSENDRIFNLMSIPCEKNADGSIRSFDPSGLVLDGDWANKQDEESDEVIQQTLRDVVGSFSQALEFNHTGTFYDKRTVGDAAALTYPLVRYNSPEHLDHKFADQLGIIVFEMVFNNDTDKVDFVLRESFVGYISNCDSEHLPIENEINTKSKYIRIIRKVRRSSYRDFFHISNQPLVVMGMTSNELQKKINYKKSLEEPINYMLDAWYSDVDSTHIDLILDAGITTVAHHAWKQYLVDPTSDIYFNPTLERIDTPKGPSMDAATFAEIECCSTAWHKIVRMFTSFIETRRGDCLFIADGPRCLNLDRNVPLLTRYPALTSKEILNRYLRYFTDRSTSYGTRIFNWVMATDYSRHLSIWMPPSVVAAEIYCNSERYSYPWYAPSGVERGKPTLSNFVSIRTKPYGDENNMLYSNQWNYFTENINTGIVLEGNKTMQLERTALDRVNVRRLCNYIKRQIRIISNRYKYEPNTAGLRMQFAEDLNSMLTYVQKNAGISSFVIQCDDTNNPNEVIERNELRCKIAIKPIKSIEYIIVDLTVTKSTIQFVENMGGTA